MSELSTAVCSITSTPRRRYFWAAWWTGAPSYAPFRKPDASHGGASSREEALAAAERAAQRHLVLIEGHWARAWKSVLRGVTATPPAPRVRRPKPAPPRGVVYPSAWSVLGLAPGASLAEVKQAFRARALQTHPDQGGDAAQFRAVHHAYQQLLTKLESKPRRRKDR